MPWKEFTTMSLRLEFVNFTLSDSANIAELCRRFNISRKTGYKWIKRFLREGSPGLADHCRRPHSSPARTSAELEDAILAIRDAHQAWGGRKIRTRLQHLGWQKLPAASTITAILQRRGRIDAAESLKHTAWQRFEAQAPNDLWQMDFKGHFDAEQGRCHPLTVLDDHSRYALGLRACSNEQTLTVRQQLVEIFHRYGLPKRMLVDNGSPWGSDKPHPFTPLTVWLIRQGITIIHSRPYHPQTLGKDERFHRTVKTEIAQYCIGLSIAQCQRKFDTWLTVYNFQRPHEALNMKVPAERYSPSSQQYRENLSPIEYSPDDQLRKVQQGGWISYQGKEYAVPKAFCGERVAVRPTETDGLFDVYFCNQRIAALHVKEPSTKNVLPISPNACYP
jgi:transposase InsO family protein